MVSIWLLGGLVISFVGIHRHLSVELFSETKQRPYTIVRQIHGLTRRTRSITATSNFMQGEQLKKVYPTEFVVRTFRRITRGWSSRSPNLAAVSSMSDSGDGRNTVFLCDQGYDVAGIEIAQGIVDQTAERLDRVGYAADLRVGRNSDIPLW